MPVPIRISLTLFATALLATINTPPDPIAPLNECIQQRFQARMSFGIERFGMSRVARPNLGIRQFHPENPTELTVLTKLKDNGYQVSLFLVGRYALDTPPFLLDQRRLGLQGPAFMTARPDDLPDPAVLLTEGKKALTEFAHQDGYDIHQGQWTVAMRPLRAEASCIQCHAAAHDPKPGDALGVAMYVYRMTK